MTYVSPKDVVGILLGRKRSESLQDLNLVNHDGGGGGGGGGDGPGARFVLRIPPLLTSVLNEDDVVHNFFLMLLEYDGLILLDYT